MAPQGKRSQDGEEVSTECRALQAATSARLTRGRTFHVSARANTPEEAKTKKELEAQTPPKAREREESASQEEGETHNTRSKGRLEQKEGREKRSTKRAETSAIANPEAFRVEEDAERNDCHNTMGAKTWRNPRGVSRQGNHRQPTVGASHQPKQGDSKTRGRGYQVAWKAKIWKNIRKCFKRDSQAKDIAVKPVLQKKKQPQEPRPETIADRNTRRTTREPPAAQGK